MEFNFNINNYFQDDIIKIGSRLIPDGFVGDRREIQDCVSKVSYIVTILGEKSAKAQGLQKVITSGEKLRNSDHTVYMLVDLKGGSKGLGTVVGLLKMGVKHLYVFDAGGKTHEITTKCILDFYVHESKQRMGLGKKLFQHMLKEERVDPVHLAIDKPSSKFLSFLLKHYGLQNIIPQMNNFVVFEGFFNNRSPGVGAPNENGQLFPAGLNTCGNQYTSGSTGFTSTSSPTYNCQSTTAMNVSNISYYGRQAPHKPISTMGMILQQKPAPSQQTPQNGREAEKKAEIASPPPMEPVTEPEEPEPEPPAEEQPEANDENDTTEPDSLAEDVKPESPKISVPVSPAETPKRASISTNESRSRLNSQGHLDLKFYHSSLW